jgi:hypothetical protein
MPIDSGWRRFPIEQQHPEGATAFASVMGRSNLSLKGKQIFLAAKVHSKSTTPHANGGIPDGPVHSHSLIMNHRHHLPTLVLVPFRAPILDSDPTKL